MQANDKTNFSQHYFMNEFSDDAIKRTDLFKRIAEQNDMQVLPGCYGGEYNNDMLAIGKQYNEVIVWLGIKVTGVGGDLQLDRKSMGSFLQFSTDWFKMVIVSLRLLGAENTAGLIEEGLLKRTLKLGLLYIDLESGEPSVLPMAIQD